MDEDINPRIHIVRGLMAVAGSRTPSMVYQSPLAVDQAQLSSGTEMSTMETLDESAQESASSMEDANLPLTVDEILSAKNVVEPVVPESVVLSDASAQLRSDLMGILNLPQTFDVTFVVGPGVTWAYPGSSQELTCRISDDSSQSDMLASSSATKDNQVKSSTSTWSGSSSSKGEIELPQTVRVLASRSLLSIRSPVFAPLLFTSGMHESQHPTEPIYLPDVDPASFVRLVEFAMTGSTSVPPDATSPHLILELHALADKFAVDTLTTCCREWLRSALTAETVVDALQQSLQLIPESLLEVCYGFVDTCPSVFESKGLLSLPLSTLKTIIQRKTLEVPEIKIFQFCVRWARAQAASIREEWIKGRKSRLIARLKSAAKAAIASSSLVEGEGAMSESPSKMFGKRKEPSGGFMSVTTDGEYMEANFDPDGALNLEDDTLIELEGLGDEYEQGLTTLKFSESSNEHGAHMALSAQWSEWSEAPMSPAQTHTVFGKSGNSGQLTKVKPVLTSRVSRGEVLPGNVYLPANIKSLVPQCIQSAFDAEAISDMAEALRRSLVAESVSHAALYSTEPGETLFSESESDIDENQSFFFSKGHHLPRRYENPYFELKRVKQSGLSDIAGVHSVGSRISRVKLESALSQVLGSDTSVFENDTTKSSSQQGLSHLDWLRACADAPESILKAHSDQMALSGPSNKLSVFSDELALDLLASSPLVHPEDRELLQSIKTDWFDEPIARPEQLKLSNSMDDLGSSLETQSMKTAYASEFETLESIVQTIRDVLQTLHSQLVGGILSDASSTRSQVVPPEGDTIANTKPAKSVRGRSRARSSGRSKLGSDEHENVGDATTSSSNDIPDQEEANREIFSSFCFKDIGHVLISEIKAFIEDELIDSSLSTRDIARMVLLPLVPHIRFGVMSTKELIRSVKPTNLVDPHVVDTALAYLSDQSTISIADVHTSWGTPDNGGAILPGGGIYYTEHYQMRHLVYMFDTSISDGTVVVSDDGQKFINLAPDVEASGTVLRPISCRSRYVTFDIKLEAHGASTHTVRKGFYGVGILRDPLPVIREGVTSKSNGTLYYSNGWISSFGQTLDKSGSLPHFEIGNKVGFRIDLEANTIQFRLDGHGVGPLVPLNEAFVNSRVMYPVVRLKSKSSATIVRS